MGAASVLGVVLALVLFMALPAFCVKTLGRFVPLAGPVKALLEAAGWQDVQRILDAEGRDRGAAARNG